MAVILRDGIDKLGVSLIALIQFAGACFLSGSLDNNIVADFASRALHGLELGTLHLFAMAQIAGYAAGGCWTPHRIGAVGGGICLYSEGSG